MFNITANKIQSLLAVKHSKDIFVPECKDGPTHTADHLRMDAWVMKRSWVRPLSIGYEIKISRQDFLNDQKWHSYLNYCNEFYFVCPAGLIDYDFGPGSFERHCERALSAGARLEIVELDSLALDMDEPEDLDLVSEEFKGFG